MILKKFTTYKNLAYLKQIFLLAAPQLIRLLNGQQNYLPVQHRFTSVKSYITECK